MYCCAQLPKTQTLNLAWESGPALRGPTCVVVVVVMVVAGLDFPGPPSAGPPSAGPPKISLFFFPFPPPFRSFCVSLGVFSLNFGGVFEGRHPEMCTFGLSGFGVNPRRPHQTGPPGLAHDSPRTPNVHISRPLRFKTPPKFHEKTPQRDTERAKRWKKKREILGPPRFGAPPFRSSTFFTFGPPTLRGNTLRGPTLRGPTGPHFFYVWATHPAGPHPAGPHPAGPHPGASLFLGLGPHPSGAPNPEKMGPRRVEGPKFRAFFSFSRHHFALFCVYLGVCSWNFGGV